MKKDATADRPCWDEVWMNITHQVARRSPDDTYKVGAIIVTSDNTQMLSLGYNGDHAGGANVKESNAPGESGFIHAEVNACIKLDYNNPKNKVMYVSMSPCKMCAKIIINAGIKEVVYSREYRDISGLTLLRHAGINVRKYIEIIEK